ncbi:MAG: peptide-methionine (S)-S-oxide reductase MsrA [Verrucomicrobiota bacterium]|nr:peptide-methionine (S)-S-oxide reductase MsrA [Verrucomicrobiota bacterium]
MKRTIIAAVIFASLGMAGATFAAEEQATFAAGCFWCMQELFERVPGVTHVVAGYAGGKDEHPTYQSVSTGNTGHSESIDLTFDPDKVSYEKLLEIFWKSHDPTNARGVAPDFGSEYRPIIFYRNAEQKAVIEKAKVEAQKKYSKPIATEIVPFEKFYPAEDYHQDYVKKNSNDPYVQNVSLPRIRETGFGEAQ